MSDTEDLDVIRSDFIEQNGLIAQAEGLPRIAGRVFGLLIFDGAPVSFSDLATRLQVSRASVSSSIRLLEERGLVRRVAKPGSRQDFFQLADAPYLTMLEGIRKRNRATLDDLKRTIDRLPADAEPLPRLADYAQFYAATDMALATALKNLRTTHDDAPHDRAASGKETSDE